MFDKVSYRKQYSRDYFLRNKDDPEFKRKAKIRNQRYWQNKKLKMGTMLTEQARNKSLKWKYGISSEEYQVMYDSQNGQCSLCSVQYSVLHVDHCHTSNKIRSLLCTTCNTGLGMFKEDIALLEKAKRYLEKYRDS